MKNPWMPMYWADFLADTGNLSHFEKSVYVLLIAHYWCNNGLPADDRQLARIAQVSDRKWKQIRVQIGAKFESNWRHKRIDFELAKALKLKERKREKDRRWADKRRTQHGRAVGVQLQSQLQRKKEATDEKEKIASGYAAVPESPEFQKWKAWAFKKNIPLWRELQSREIEGRAFDFATQWPPN